ncbi:hypothetical protein JCGZ_09902 [Jatropha curcas]|uniref:NB-ARC domain-containing protein n=1 Tax=Jatropha curcas TaxID=180498 RepID=A0A067KUH4_JATCU|nr:hypothetical protein JCGZ_09902 [Jatropha curcas]
MEEIVLSPLLQVIYDRVASPVLQRLADMWDLKDTLKRLQQSLLMVQAILEDAEEQQVTRKAVRVWLSMVKSAASDAEDLLNEFTARGSLDVDHGVPANLEGYPAVIPIIGIGGIGKTTLAQLAYNDEIATQHFDVKTWVFVSENFDVKRIMKAIIESATKERYLYSLQSLNLHGCCYLEQLPSLPEANLRHLIITECQALELMPDILPQGLRTLPIYILRFGRLLGLKDLDLHGELKIKRLQKVKTRDDAESANMRLKENLKSLGLYWCENDGQLDNRIDAVEDILEALQPHQNLEELHMEGYPGIKFPNWSLPNLIMVNLSNCKKCECLPTLGNLAFLKMVSFCGMDGVKGIGLEFYGEGMHTPFPELEELTIKGFPNLEEWSIVNDGQTFPKLRKLIVNNCPRLAKMPSFRSLQHLELRDCSQTIFSNENLPSLSILAIEKIPELFSLPRSFLVENTLLTSLEIISCPKLHSLPSELGSLISLKTLTIRWCEELTSLPQSLQNLKALEYLEICECHNIISLPDNGLGGLTSLRILSIENCSKLISLSSSLEHLTSLEQLTIMYCPSLSSLPEGLQHLSALRSLTMLSCPLFSTLPEELQYVTTLLCLEIHSCPGLTALPEWFRNLTSLRSLTISDCHNLKCLPESFSFSALQYLCIQDCPRLEERSN